jgi:hypothetical protein
MGNNCCSWGDVLHWNSTNHCSDLRDLVFNSCTVQWIKEDVLHYLNTH